MVLRVRLGTVFVEEEPRARTWGFRVSMDVENMKGRGGVLETHDHVRNVAVEIPWFME